MLNDKHTDTQKLQTVIQIINPAAWGIHKSTLTSFLSTNAPTNTSPMLPRNIIVATMRTGANI